MSRTLFTAEWFPYYFERFEGSDRVAAMTLAEEGAYHRAIRLAWRFGSVPSDPKLLAGRIEKRCSEKVAKVILQMFEPSPNDPKKMIHPTVEEIRAVQKAKYETRKKWAKNAADKRWELKTLDASGMRNAMPEQCPSNAYQDLDIDLDLKRLIKRAREKPQNAKRDPRLVEIGILYTLLQRNGDDPIRSVAYFQPEIEKVCRDSKALKTKGIDALLRRRREQWQDMQQK